MNEAKLVATITEEEAEKFKAFNIIEESIRLTIEDLVLKRANYLLDKQNYFSTLSTKYGFVGSAKYHVNANDKAIYEGNV